MALPANDKYLLNTTACNGAGCSQVYETSIGEFYQLHMSVHAYMHAISIVESFWSSINHLKLPLDFISAGVHSSLCAPGQCLHGQ